MSKEGLVPSRSDLDAADGHITEGGKERQLTEEREKQFLAMERIIRSAPTVPVVVDAALAVAKANPTDVNINKAESLLLDLKNKKHGEVASGVLLSELEAQFAVISGDRKYFDIAKETLLRECTHPGVKDEDREKKLMLDIEKAESGEKVDFVANVEWGMQRENVSYLYWDRPCSAFVFLSEKETDEFERMLSVGDVDNARQMAESFSWLNRFHAWSLIAEKTMSEDDFRKIVEIAEGGKALHNDQLWFLGTRLFQLARKFDRFDLVVGFIERRLSTHSQAVLLMEAAKLTGDVKYIESCEESIMRTLHARGGTFDDEYSALVLAKGYADMGDFDKAQGIAVYMPRVGGEAYKKIAKRIPSALRFGRIGRHKRPDYI